MSIQRAYSQRNMNLTQIIPEFDSILPNLGGEGAPFDISGSAVYVLTLPKIQSTGGVFYVDLSGNDASGNLLDFSGIVTVNTNTAYIINFVVNVPFPASYAPGLEFTIFFKNIPYSTIPSEAPPFVTIGILSEKYLSQEGIPIPYIFSPPLPSFIANLSENFSNSVSNSLTFKSDGTHYNIISSGPAGWLGLGVFAMTLGYNGGGP